MDLTDKIKVGDRLIRMLAGTLEIPGVVTEIDEKEGTFLFNGAWTFDIKTGVEIDEDLHWGPKYGASGSFIKPF